LPFWSDGVSKERYIVLPEGEHLRVLADGDLEVPKGTLLIKNFRHEGKLFETRFYVRHADGEYSGYSYAHRDDGSAELVDETRVEKVGEIDWIYPGRGACNQCHSAAAGRSLGLELRQLAIVDGDDDQLERLTEAGVFSSKPAAFASHPRPDSEESLESRARAYLHVNCSNCHRPDGPARGGLDLRVDTALSSTGLCELAELGKVGTQDGALIAPGDFENSVIHARLSQRGEAQMPPLASNVVDAAGAALIAEWIDSLDGCP
jgi:mono/diheme cytochrome c family protein